MLMYKVSPGRGEDGFIVILLSVDSAFNPKGSLDSLFGLIRSDIACAIMN